LYDLKGSIAHNLGVIILSAVAIACSPLICQTISSNRIGPPSKPI